MSKLPFLFFFLFPFFLFLYFPSSFPPPLLINSALSIRDARSRSQLPPPVAPPPGVCLDGGDPPRPGRLHRHHHPCRRRRMLHSSASPAPRQAPPPGPPPASTSTTEICPASADDTAPADACSPPPPRLHLGRCLLPRSAPPPRVRRCLLCPFAASSLLPPAVAAAMGTTRGQRWEKGGGAGWSHEIVAPPPLRKSRGAPGAAPPLESLQNQPFGRAPPGAARGAGAEAGALPNGAYIYN
jgi:hypothetical protein